MFITEDQYQHYIVKGAIINRIHNSGNHLMEVLCDPFDYTMIDGRTLKRFKYRSMDSQHKGEYFVSDLFNGEVEIKNPETASPHAFRIFQEEFEV